MMRGGRPFVAPSCFLALFRTDRDPIGDSEKQGMLREFLPDTGAVEALLQLFQSAALVYLVSGDRERGLRSLVRLIEMETSQRQTRKLL